MSVIKADFVRKHPAQAVLTVLGLSGVLLIFLPFVYSYTPAEVFLESLNNNPVLVAPCVILPFVISIGYLRWLLIGPLSRGEKITGYVFALLAAYSVLIYEIADMVYLNRPVRIDDFYFLSMLGVGALFGALFVILNARSTPASVPNALVAMQVAYLPLTMTWVLAGIDDGQAGWYFAVVTVLVYSTQNVMLAKRIWYALIFFIPLALVYTALFLLENVF